MIGKTLGHYEILALLGKGGMGEVYRARDKQLGREVAVKVLPPLDTEAEGRFERFRQEARTIAALDHPNIVTLYTIEEADGVPFLTMELVEGISLTQRLRQGPLSMDEFLRIAVQIADGVSTAHRKHVTHRDLKPDNVMIEPSGRVKILDFGVAKLLAPDGDADDATRPFVRPETTEGHVMGTAAYMSPEQAEGKAVDARSDVFSLGIIFYEMAARRRPFQGSSPISTISAILKDDPTPIFEIDPTLPRQLGRILDRCLAKDPERRYQSALGLRNALESLQNERDSAGFEIGETEKSTKTIPRWARAVALLAVVAGSYLIGRVGRDAPPSDRVVVVGQERLTSRGARENYPSLDPSGTLFIYSARDGKDLDVFLQRRGGERPINLTEDSPVDDDRPAMSFDGAMIAFESERAGGGIFVMGATGESVRRVTDEGHHPAWSPDAQRIVYSTSDWTSPAGRDDEGVLRVVNVSGGSPVDLTPSEIDAAQPDWSHGGEWIVFWGVRRARGQRDLWMIRSDGSDLVELTDDGAVDWTPRFGVGDRHVYFVSNRGGTNNLWRIEIDAKAGNRVGDPEPITLGCADVGRFDVSVDGSSVIFASRSTTSAAWSARLSTGVDRASPPREITKNPLYVKRPVLSPDGTQIVFYNLTDFGAQDVFLTNVDGSDLRRLTRNGARDRGPSWHPSGDRVVFYSDRGGAYELWTMRPDGSDVRQISDIQARGVDSQWFPMYSPTGSMLVAMNEHGTYLYDVDATTGLLGNERSIAAPDDRRFFFQAWDHDTNRLVGWTGDRPADGSGGVWVHEVDNGRWMHVVEHLSAGWPGLAFSRDGRSVLVMTREKLVAIELAAAPIVDLSTPSLQLLDEGFEDDHFVSSARDSDLVVYQRVEYQSTIWLAGLEATFPE